MKAPTHFAETNYLELVMEKVYLASTASLSDDVRQDDSKQYIYIYMCFTGSSHTLSFPCDTVNPSRRNQPSYHYIRTTAAVAGGAVSVPMPFHVMPVYRIRWGTALSSQHLTCYITGEHRHQNRTRSWKIWWYTWFLFLSWVLITTVCTMPPRQWY